MQIKEFEGLTITLSDGDTNKLKESWQKQHWRCIVYNKIKRKQMGFDIYGDGGYNSVMNPKLALLHYLEDAVYYMDEEPYEKAKDRKAGENAYFKCRKFIGTDDDIISLYRKLI